MQIKMFASLVGPLHLALFCGRRRNGGHLRNLRCARLEMSVTSGFDHAQTHTHTPTAIENGPAKSAKKERGKKSSRIFNPMRYREE